MKEGLRAFRGVCRGKESGESIGFDTHVPFRACEMQMLTVGKQGRRCITLNVPVKILAGNKVSRVGFSLGGPVCEDGSGVCVRRAGW